MHSLSEAEILVLVEALQPLVGARLQEVVVSDKGCGLGFWIDGHLVWVWCDMHTWFPVVLPLTEVPERSRKPAPPLLLFLKAHFVGRRIAGISQIEELGRALRFDLSESDSPEGWHLDIYLWPHGQNILAVAGPKKIFFRKPSSGGATPLAKSGEKSMAPPARDLQTILNQWDGSRKHTSSQTKSVEKPRKSQDEERLAANQFIAKERRRLERAIAKIQEDVLSKKTNPWREVGQWVTAHQSLKVPSEWRIYVDQRRSLAWNIESIFSQAKEGERKIEAAEARIAELREELKGLGHIKNPVAFFNQKKSKKVSSRTSSSEKKKASSAKFRTVRLSNEFEVWVGRSGKDNLEILRAARPWHYWMHLRDYPGPHAILPRHRDVLVSDQTLQDAARAIADLQFGTKAASHRGDVLSVIVAEVRHIRPIKGDRLGRVQFQSERIFRFKY